MAAPGQKHLDDDTLDRIGRLELRARQVVEGFVSGMHQSPFKGFSVEFADHREYAPGDDLRHIDWRVHARTDRLFVKQYEVETNVRAHLLLDCSASMAYPDQPVPGRLNKWDYAATVALSLAHLLVTGQSDAASLVLFDQKIRERTPISANRVSLQLLARTLEHNAPAGGTDTRIPFAELAESVPRRGTVIVISDLLTGLDPLIEGLQRLRAASHEIIILQVLDHDEIEFPFTDRTLFEGLEAPDSEVLTDPQSLRRSYLDAVGRFLGTLETACLERRIDYALFSTADPVQNALATFLARRTHRNRSRR